MNTRPPAASLEKIVRMTSDNPFQPFRDAYFTLSVVNLGGLPADEGAEVAIAGRSNAGKSSAINALAQRRQLARTSKTPGRTQALNFFSLGDPDRSLVDLPGYGFSQVPWKLKQNWDRLIGGYLTRRRCLKGLVVVMDVRHPLTPLDRQLLEWFVPTQKPVHVLLTKADKLTRGAGALALVQARRELLRITPGATVQLFSALTHSGAEDAARRIMAIINSDLPPADPAAGVA
jgi:GTP-binding protein